MPLDSSRQDGHIQLQDPINFAVLVTCHVLIKHHRQQQQHNFCHHRLMKCMDRYCLISGIAMAEQNGGYLLAIRSGAG